MVQDLYYNLIAYLHWNSNLRERNFQSRFFSSPNYIIFKYLNLFTYIFFFLLEIYTISCTFVQVKMENILPLPTQNLFQIFFICQNVFNQQFFTLNFDQENTLKLKALCIYIQKRNFQLLFKYITFRYLFLSPFFC